MGFSEVMSECGGRVGPGFILSRNGEEGSDEERSNDLRMNVREYMKKKGVG